MSINVISYSDDDVQPTKVLFSGIEPMKVALFRNVLLTSIETVAIDVVKLEKFPNNLVTYIQTIKDRISLFPVKIPQKIIKELEYYVRDELFTEKNSIMFELKVSTDREKRDVFSSDFKYIGSLKGSSKPKFVDERIFLDTLLPKSELHIKAYAIRRSVVKNNEQDHIKYSPITTNISTIPKRIIDTSSLKLTDDERRRITEFLNSDSKKSDIDEQNTEDEIVFINRNMSIKTKLKINEMYHILSFYCIGQLTSKEVFDDALKIYNERVKKLKSAIEQLEESDGE